MEMRGLKFLNTHKCDSSIFTEMNGCTYFIYHLEHINLAIENNLTSLSENDCIMVPKDSTMHGLFSPLHQFADEKQ